jgi:hypothetical protein
MKAIDVAKKLYSSLSKQDLKGQTCPDILMITDKVYESCKVTRCEYLCDDCEQCWEQEISQDKIDWLIECKNMCDLMGC